MARLIIKRKGYGAHTVVIQFRNADDFSPISGMEFGDLGMKMRFNGTSNGYAIFSNVRIPRTNLLMGHVCVDKDGTYTNPLHDKVAYVTMPYARAVIAEGAGFKVGSGCHNRNAVFCGSRAGVGVIQRS